MTDVPPRSATPEPPIRIAGDGGPDTDDWTCSCGLTRPVTGSYGCADCGDARPDSWERRTHPWEQQHNDSCECHIGICGECGCTNEYTEARSVPPSEPPALDVIDYLDREGVLTFADDGHRQRVIDGLAALRPPAEDAA